MKNLNSFTFIGVKEERCKYSTEEDTIKNVNLFAIYFHGNDR